jgi:dinuclear metal center YbgI/SA1388 family protein
MPLMGDRVADWTSLVAARYPPADAASWDRVGLQVGAPDDEVDGVLVSLDVTEAVLDEAEAVGAGLVIAHHPLLLRGLERLTPDTAAGRLALEAARRRIAVLAAHTNFDVADDGTSDPVVRLLDLRDVRPLQGQPDPATEVVKLTTFVPREDTGKVVAALSAAGAGVIGEYTECSFRVPGTGTFRPSAAANPSVGERERRTEVAEDRLEVEVPRPRLAEAVAALWDAHPYEEVAYDVYQLVDDRAPVKGLGRVGDLTEPVPLRTIADTLAGGLPAPHLRVAGDLRRTIRRVAVTGGAGDSLIDVARSAGADVYVTGDLRHHPALDALTNGLALIDAGHYATEAAALPAFRRALTEAAGRRGLQASIHASAVRTEPWADYRPGE